MRLTILSILLLSCVLLSCNDNKKTYVKETTPSDTFQNKGHELVHGMVKKVGDYNSFASKKNVRYTYTYQTPDGAKDVSTEMYIFDGELSYGNYKIHERTIPQLAGVMEQGYDGREFWFKHNGEILKDSTYLKRVAFNRPTNFYWFLMMPKLLDPGVVYEHLGEETISNKAYDVVKITFKNQGDKPTDIYQLYINKSTQLVDQFLFTVADFGVMDAPYLMQLVYETIEGIPIPSHRKYKTSTWDAEVTDAPWIRVNWSDIQFNVNLVKEDFRKEHTMIIDDIAAKN